MYFVLIVSQMTVDQMKGLSIELEEEKAARAEAESKANKVTKRSIYLVLLISYSCCIFYFFFLSLFLSFHAVTN